MEMITGNPKEFWDEKSRKKNWRDYILPKRSDDEFWEEGKIEALKVKKYIDDNSFVIDYGCGIGRMTEPISKYCKYTVGLDICNNFIRNITSTPNKKYYSIDNFKYKNIATFIFSISVIQHNTLENRLKMVNHIYDLLKNGGKCFINFPIKGAIYKGESEFVYTFTKEEIENMFKRFSKIEIIKGNLVGYGGRDPRGLNEYFLIATK